VVRYLAEVAARMETAMTKPKDLSRALPKVLGFPKPEKWGPRRKLTPGIDDRDGRLVILFAFEIFRRGRSLDEAVDNARKPLLKTFPELGNLSRPDLKQLIAKFLGRRSLPRDPAELRAALAKLPVLPAIGLIEQKFRET
jgi:hypothetical protein